METVAFATAEPDASVTVPERVAPATCAYTAAPPSKLNKNNVIDNAKHATKLPDLRPPKKHLPEDYSLTNLTAHTPEHETEITDIHI
jgi:hypothetical protein